MTKINQEKHVNSKLCPIIFKFTELGSTNNLARKYIEDENNIGFVIAAETQTAGYGQRGNYWESPRGGLWCSLAIKPYMELQSLGVVPILSSVGIAKTLRKYNVNTTLKWPNDILLSKSFKKLGGILVEGKITQYSLNYLIIGIGLNINNTLTQYSRPLRSKITTTYEELNKEISLDKLLGDIIKQIDESFEKLRSKGVRAILEDWKQHDNILGMDIVVQDSEKEYHGKAVDISPYGHLVLKTSDSNIKNISNGRIILFKNS
ncbi:MAG: biotin--[acetyl-CoA-carboxylase] ligase [Candidatus Hodarchaeota archaeon]